MQIHPTRHSTRFSLALLCLVLLGAGCTEEKQPNILFIFADDHSYEAIGAMGILDIDTPHLDRLMEQGTTFTHTYNMGSWTGAVCIASRTMLNTGTSVWRAPRNRRAFAEHIQKGDTWSQRLGTAGYRTYMTGKWHLPSKVEPLFDVVADVRPGMPADVPEGYNRPLDEADYQNGWKPWETQYGGFWEGGTHWSEIIAGHAVDFLARAAKEPNPFFMYLAFNAPHDPRQAPREYVEQYPLERVEVPTNFLTKYPYQDEIGCGPELRDARLAPFPRSEYAVKVNRQEYYAIISHMDAQIGRILDALEASGKADNTYIFFTADHGLAVGHHGLIGKQNMYEHSLRVPFIVVGPKVKKGATRTQPIYLQDIMPTTLELAGAEIPASVEFKSLLPLLQKNKGNHYEQIYGCYKTDLQRAIISGDHKLVLYPTIPATRLYNLKTDPEERIDLAGKPESAETLKQLRAEFEALQVAFNDPLRIED